MKINYSLVLIWVVALSSCFAFGEVVPPGGFLISEGERNVRDWCIENQDTEVAKVIDYIEGEWELIGYACGFCTPHESPEANIIFEEDRGVLIISDDFTDQENIEFTYTLEEKMRQDGRRYLDMTTEPRHYALQISYFCEEYLAYDATPVDGIMVIYQKQ